MYSIVHYLQKKVRKIHSVNLIISYKRSNMVVGSSLLVIVLSVYKGRMFFYALLLLIILFLNRFIFLIWIIFNFTYIFPFLFTFSLCTTKIYWLGQINLISRFLSRFFKRNEAAGRILYYLFDETLLWLVLHTCKCNYKSTSCKYINKES